MNRLTIRDERRRRSVASIVVLAVIAACSSCSGSPASSEPIDTFSSAPAPLPTIMPTTVPITVPTTSTTLPTTSTTSSTTSSVPRTRAITTRTTTTTSTTVVTVEAVPNVQSKRLPAPRDWWVYEPLPVVDGIAALTGLPTDAETSGRAALAVKIDNSPSARPQWNLADADVVFEENVEGITRFIAFYQTNQPDRIGPVRSARTGDLDVLAGMNRPILAWSGGNPGVSDAVWQAHYDGWLADLSAQRSNCFFRSRRRNAPHNLLVVPACARDSATFAGPARIPFSFSDDPSALQVAGATAATTATVAMDGVTTKWTFDSTTGRYLRSQNGQPHVDVDGDRVSADNVVVMTVEYVKSAADQRSPEPITVGEGPVVVYRDGLAISGRWSRLDRYSAYVVVAGDGTEIKLSTGKTFVQLSR